MFLFIFYLIVSLVGFFLVKFRNRTIFGGLFMTSGIILLVTNFLILVIEVMKEQFHKSEMINLITYHILIPLVFLATCGFLISNSRTMSRKEGKSITAKLSAGLAINLVVTSLTLALSLTDTLKLPTIFRLLFLFTSVLDLVLTFIFVSYLFYSWIYQMFPIKRKIDYIIVLGSGISSEEVPPLLKSRLDKGIEYFQKNPKAIFIVSGGKGNDEPVSEAYAMKKYLLSQNISENQIILENQSRTTYENMLYSKKIIDKDWKDYNLKPSIIFSTSNYHVLRAHLYAKRVNLKAEGVGAPTALYFLPTAIIREYIAFLSHNKFLILNIVIILCILLLIFFNP